MALFFVKLYAFFTPYTDDSDDVLAEVGQYQILFTFFGALIVQGGLIRSSLYGLLGVILVAINIAILVVPMRFLYKEHLEAEAKKEEKLRKELEKKKEDDELTSFMRKERERYGADDDAISPYEGPRQKELLNARVQSFTEEEEAKPPESSPSSALHLPSSSSHKYQSKPQDNKMTLKPLPPSSLSRNKILPSPRVEDHYGDGKEHDGMDDYKPAPR